MTDHQPRDGFSPGWLALREPADRRARTLELAHRAANLLTGSPRVVVHDLGCGTGAMARWLAPLLPGPQHWVLHDRDPDLLAVAVTGLPATAIDGNPVTAETHPGDVTRLGAADLADAGLVTTSALLDLLTADEIDAIIAACTAAGVPALLTLSVAGGVDLTPAHPLDDAVAAAFDAHQRRDLEGRRLLGPDAGAHAARAFAARGAQVEVRLSPWRLGPSDTALVQAWLSGWVAAAQEQEPSLAAALREYLADRLEVLAAGRLEVSVHHHDLLAVPGDQPGDQGAASRTVRGTGSAAGRRPRSA